MQQRHSLALTEVDEERAPQRAEQQQPHPATLNDALHGKKWQQNDIHIKGKAEWLILYLRSTA